MKTSKPHILLLEDDPDLQELIKSYYEPRGYAVTCYEDPSIPLAQFRASERTERSAHAPEAPHFDVVLTDLKMPKMDGMAFIQKMKTLAPTVPIILMTSHSSVELAIQAIEAGAYDFVVKPLHFQQLSLSIGRAIRLAELQAQNEALRITAKSTWSFEGAVGKSAQLQAVFDLAKRVSNSVATVLITGESGTGKEVIARSIHQHGNRRDQNFVAINCSAIPENLLESELFGYAKGAFTGAADKRLGLFEEANGGTLFLDEIGDLSLPLQAKLLRVLQERKIKRIGENQFRPVDVRILAATHKDLKAEVREKRFREDLFFRLNVIPIRIPPLRERTEDILPLAEHFLRKFAAQNASPATGFTKGALEHLMKLKWPGNVRELENAVERAVVLCDQPLIDVADLPAPESVTTAPAALFAGLSPNSKLPTLEELSQSYIEHVMRSVEGVREHAARVLDVDRKTLYRKLKELEAIASGSGPGLTTARSQASSFDSASETATA
jgi:DNA-binding NtrC family response regulator